MANFRTELEAKNPLLPTQAPSILKHVNYNAKLVKRYFKFDPRPFNIEARTNIAVVEATMRLIW